MNELRRKPILSCYSESISPLNFSVENEDLIEFAAAGLPVFFTGCPMLGVTGPATITGTYTLGNAETLAALTLSQLVKPGTPFVYGPGVGIADLRNLRFSFAAPEYAMGHIIQSQLAEFYQIPAFGWGGCCDSKTADTQAGAEAMLMSVMSALSGTNMIHCCGYLSGSQYGSMEMAVICDEVAAMVHRLLDGMTVDKESLALDVIREVGPQGNYLTRKHTRAHLMKEVFVPKLFDRDSEPVWMGKGGKNIREVAKERVHKLLAQHHPTPLSDDTKAALASIVNEAVKNPPKGTEES
jgi:trimethylamine--corrinoid protein Co-methyltransferase